MDKETKKHDQMRRKKCQVQREPMDRPLQKAFNIHNCVYKK